MAELERIKLVSDHTDEGGEELEDLLKRDDMVDALAGAILGVNPPFTFGVYGGWGSGKTYFMKLVRDRIRKDIKPGEAMPIIIEFEAWRHAKDERPDLSLVLSAYNELTMSDEYQVAADKEDRRDSAKQKLQALLSSNLEVSFQIPFFSVKASTDEVSKNLSELQEEAGEVAFDEKQKQIELHKKFEQVLDVLSHYDEKAHRIIFLIDDLDRCSPKDVVGMLEKIKLFLWHPQCVFVLGADEGAVQRAILQEIKGAENKEIIENSKTAESYLDKIVNYPFRLPPVNPTTNDEFLRRKIDTGDAAEETSVTAIFNEACDHAGASLRTMVQLANTYKFSRFLAHKAITRAKAEGRTNEDYVPEVMAVLAALQVLHPYEFDRLCRGAADREARLAAFFSVDPDEEVPDPIGLKTVAERIKVENVTYTHYVEFLVSQSENKPSASRTRKASWTWYEKDYPRDEDAGSIQDAIDAIRNGDKEVRIDGYSWRVLDDDCGEGRVFLVTKHIIGHGPIDMSDSYNGYVFDWQACDLKNELNSVGWLADHLPELSQDGRIEEGRDGKVFLLSVKEAENENYFPDAYSRIAKRIHDEKGYWWWLRSRGSNANDAALVSDYGTVYDNGLHVDYGGGVRPALWLNLKS